MPQHSAERPQPDALEMPVLVHVCPFTLRFLGHPGLEQEFNHSFNASLWLFDHRWTVFTTLFGLRQVLMSPTAMTADAVLVLGALVARCAVCLLSLCCPNYSVCRPYLMVYMRLYRSATYLLAWRLAQSVSCNLLKAAALDAFSAELWTSLSCAIIFKQHLLVSTTSLLLKLAATITPGGICDALSTRAAAAGGEPCSQALGFFDATTRVCTYIMEFLVPIAAVPVSKCKASLGIGAVAVGWVLPSSALYVLERRSRLQFLASRGARLEERQGGAGSLVADPLTLGVLAYSLIPLAYTVLALAL